MMKKVNKAVKNICLFAFGILLSIQLNGQTEKVSIGNGLGIGFQLSQYQNNFGLGINLNSPYFLYEKVGIRLRANIMYNEYVKNQETVWTPYSNLMLGLVSGRTKIADAICLYGEGGVVLLFPDDDFSSTSTEIGGYGLFGFEFYHANEFNYFIEIGGIGIGAIADKVENKPIYSNGLLINVGFRIQLNN